jgi:hypothetical protein
MPKTKRAGDGPLGRALANGRTDHVRSGHWGVGLTQRERRLLARFCHGGRPPEGPLSEVDPSRPRVAGEAHFDPERASRFGRLQIALDAR